MAEAAAAGDRMSVVVSQVDPFGPATLNAPLSARVVTTIAATMTSPAIANTSERLEDDRGAAAAIPAGAAPTTGAAAGAAAGGLGAAATAPPAFGAAAQPSTAQPPLSAQQSW